MKLLLVTFATILLLGGSQNLRAEADQKIFLLRHAEKQKTADSDPPLTAEGKKRAAHLVELFKSSSIKHIYSSDYQRTMETAKPLAESLGLVIQQYDAARLEEFASQLKQTSGNIVVVGHSNTTPKLSELLGGQSHGQMDEAEYDLYYLLEMNNSKVSTRLIKMNVIP